MLREQKVRKRFFFVIMMVIMITSFTFFVPILAIANTVQEQSQGEILYVSKGSYAQGDETIDSEEIVTVVTKEQKKGIIIIPQPTKSLIIIPTKTPTSIPTQTPTPTATPTPTPTSKPTATPMPTVKGVKELNKTMYVVSTVNVRSGHSTKYDKIGSLATGEPVKVIGQSEQTGWYRIIYNGKEGYVSNNYLQDNPLSGSIPFILNNATLNPKKSAYEPLNEVIDQTFSEILNDDMTTYEKVKTCYDYLIENCIYGVNIMNDYFHSWDYFWSGDFFLYSMEDLKAYGMLTGFVGGCSDYSPAFATMMQAIGLDCYTVDGETSAAAGGYLYHVWCEMLIDDVIYVFDPQVEDNIAKGGTINYYRFGKTYEQVPEKYIKYTYEPVEPEPFEPGQPNIDESEGAIKEILEGKEGDFEYRIKDGKAKIVKFTGYDVSKVVIPEEIEGYPVTSIGVNAFEGFSNLKKIDLPQTLVSIEDEAFAYCENLTNIYIPKNVSSIGDNVFEGCDNIVIMTVKNCYAETYAKENNIKKKFIIK